MVFEARALFRKSSRLSLVAGRVRCSLALATMIRVGGGGDGGTSEPERINKLQQLPSFGRRRRSRRLDLWRRRRVGRWLRTSRPRTSAAGDGARPSAASATERRESGHSSRSLLRLQRPAPALPGPVRPLDGCAAERRNRIGRSPSSAGFTFAHFQLSATGAGWRAGRQPNSHARATGGARAGPR